MEELNISGIKAGADEADEDEAKEDARGNNSMADLLKKRREARAAGAKTKKMDSRMKTADLIKKELRRVKWDADDIVYEVKVNMFKENKVLPLKN